MKFLHTSDWHLGRQFHNVSLLDDQRHVLNQILDHIQEQQVDALVIAGDIYDRAVPPAAAVDVLDEFLNTVCQQLNVPVILIPGNHDSAERLRFGARQLRQAGLHIFADLDQITVPAIIKAGDEEVHFYGVPYCDPETVRAHSNEDLKTHDQAHTFLVNKIHQAKNARVNNVLISHCFVDGAEASESERPLAIGGADRVSFEPLLDFNYVALGHLHGPQFRGEKHICYSGSPLKYSFSEARHNKSVTLVELNAQGERTITKLPLKALHDVRIIEGELSTIVEQGRTDPFNQDYLLVRLTDRHALLDPMNKLREVYANVLHLEKPGMLHLAEQAPRRDALKRNELDMFHDFFSQITGQELTPPQDQALQTILRELRSQNEISIQNEVSSQNEVKGQIEVKSQDEVNDSREVNE
jgi:DNA repair protein SbcD/Mre11